jgi:hypothetical protein
MKWNHIQEAMAEKKIDQDLLNFSSDREPKSSTTTTCTWVSSDGQGHPFPANRQEIIQSSDETRRC